MNLDISEILRSWDHHSGSVTSRKIRGTDGRMKVQMRLDLGLLQMEIDGRPDGTRPFGFESLLEYQLSRLEDYKAQNGTDFGFSLPPEQCTVLRDEALQYYYRYLCLFHLEEYALVERDTQRNLRVFDLIRDFAAEEEDRTSLEAYRAYVVMMGTQARVRQSVADGEHKRALEQVFHGLDEIREYFNSIGRESSIERSGEILVLKQLADEIARTMPRDPIQKLRERLKRAVQREDFDRAAQIRDQIRALEAEEAEEQRTGATAETQGTQETNRT